MYEKFIVGNDNKNFSLPELICPYNDNKIFVSVSGNDNVICGSIEYPCSSIPYSFTSRLILSSNICNNVIILMGYYTLKTVLNIRDVILTSYYEEEDIKEILIEIEDDILNENENAKNILTIESGNLIMNNLSFILPSNMSTMIFIDHKSEGYITLKNVNIINKEKSSYTEIWNSIIIIEKGDLNIENSTFKNIRLTKDGNGSILNCVIETGHIINITDCSFTNISAEGINSHGGCMYGFIWSGGYFVISGKNDETNEESYTFSNITTGSHDNSGSNEFKSYGGAISLILDDNINDDSSFILNGINFFIF
jgi:hypothetical protein